MNAPTDRVRADALTREDSVLLSQVNQVLKFANRPEIPASATIDAGDLAGFRDTVQEALAKVGDARGAWERQASGEIRQQRRLILETVARGAEPSPEDYQPRMSAERVPYEVRGWVTPANSTRSYPTRAAPIGANSVFANAIGAAEAYQLNVFDIAVRQMFH
ncbi:MAG: hypothetical protein U1F36_16900 [Planctomycetota bacterium]